MDHKVGGKKVEMATVVRWRAGAAVTKEEMAAVARVIMTIAMLDEPHHGTRQQSPQRGSIRFHRNVHETNIPIAIEATIAHGTMARAVRAAGAAATARAEHTSNSDGVVLEGMHGTSHMHVDTIQGRNHPNLIHIAHGK